MATTETLGLPGGLHLHPLGLGDLFGLTPGCEFGVCTSIGDNIVGVAAAGAGTLICQIAEPCGGIEDTGLAAALLLLAITHHFAKKADIRFARDVAKAVEEICGPGRITSDQIHDLLHWGHYGSFNEAVQDIAAIACPEKVGKTH